MKPKHRTPSTSMQNKRKPPHLYKGEKAEEQAYNFLITKGFKPVFRNYRCKLGEIDLIMEDDKALVFIEVRYRKTDKFGSALESITAKKQSRIIAATQCYLAANRTDQPVRFDVVAISGDNSLNWVRNAFQT